MCKSVSSSSVHGTDMSLHRRLDEQTVLVTGVIVVVNTFILKFFLIQILEKHSHIAPVIHQKIFRHLKRHRMRCFATRHCNRLFILSLQHTNIAWTPQNTNHIFADCQLALFCRNRQCLYSNLNFFVAQQQACIQIAATIYTQARLRTSLFCFLLYQLSLWWVKYRAQPEAIST